MQRDIVSGRLICSKEEAATLAAVQLRLEAWPEENLELAEGSLFIRKFSDLLILTKETKQERFKTNLIRFFSSFTINLKQKSMPYVRHRVKSVH